MVGHPWRDFMTIRDFTTGKTEFVQLVINAPDGRFPNRMVGGLFKNSALFEAKKYPKEMLIDIFDSEV